MLYLIRHGTTTLNSRTSVQEPTERIRGWLPISLDDDGINQAKFAGSMLIDKNIERFYSSPLQRAMETSMEISRCMNLPFVCDNGLTPWNIGNLSGTSLSYAIPIMTQHFEHPLVIIEDGESYSMFYNRWKRFLFDLLEKSHNTNICAVTHSRNLYCLDHILTNGQKPITFVGQPAPGGILSIDSLGNIIEI